MKKQEVKDLWYISDITWSHDIRLILVSRPIRARSWLSMGIPISLLLPLLVPLLAERGSHDLRPILVDYISHTPPNTPRVLLTNQADEEKFTTTVNSSRWIATANTQMCLNETFFSYYLYIKSDFFFFHNQFVLKHK